VACLIALWTRFGAPADNKFASSDSGQALLSQYFHRQSGDPLTLAISSRGQIRSPGVTRRVSRALVPFAHAAHATSVTGPYQVPGQVSGDGHITFATVQFGVPCWPARVSEGRRCTRLIQVLCPMTGSPLGICRGWCPATTGDCSTRGARQYA
jgi:hypothetical protein